MAKFQVTPIIGLPQFNGWSQITTNSRRSLICSMAVFGQNAGNIGRDIVGVLDSADPRSAAELHTLLQAIVDDAIKAGGQPAMACLLTTGKHSILETYQGSVLLKRSGKVGVILSSQDQLKVLEGTYVPADTLVLTTAQGSSYLGEIQQKINQGYDIDTIITSLVPAIHAFPNSSLTSLAFVTLGEWEPEPAPELPPEPEPPAFEMPEFEITLETIAQDQELAERESALEPALETVHEEISEVDLDVVPETKAPSNIMWTKSSKTESLIVPKKLVSKTMAKLKSLGGKVVAKGKAGFKRIHWASLNPVQLWQRFSQKDVYVTRQSRQQLLRILVPMVIVVACIIVGVFFWRNRQAQQVQAAELAAEPVTARFNQAKDQIADNPVTARQQMEESVAELEKLVQDFSDSPAGRQRLDQILATTQDEFTELSGREELSSLPIFFDLNSVEAAWIANQAEAEGSQLALMDEGKKQVALMDIESKTTRLLSPLELQPIDLSLTADRIYVLGQGIWSAELRSSEAQFNRDIEEGDSNREGSLLGTFGPYVYVVNPARRNIYRYTRGVNGFSDPIGWFKPGQRFSYDNLNSLSIDGDIWIGTTDGKIHKLSMGEVADYQIKGLPEAFTSSLIIFTKENLQYVYVLEPASRRLVILQKTGEFVRQIKSGSLAAATSLAVSETAGKAFVVSGSLIFEVSL